MEIVCDFETVNHGGCDLPTVGSDIYSRHPDTKVLCFGWRPRSLGEPFHLWTPADLVDYPLHKLATSPTVKFVAHNAGFEKDIWRNIMVPQYGMPDIPNDRWVDTMARCAQLSIPQSLDKALRFLKLGQKDMQGSLFTRKLSRAVRGKYPELTPEALARVYEYNKSDVDEETMLHLAIGHLTGSEYQVWLMDQEINERGVLVDLDFVDNCQAVVDGAKGPLLAKFAKITGGLKPGQISKFLEWLRAQGVILPNMKKETLDELGLTDEDDNDETVAQTFKTDDLPRNARRVLFIRSLVGSAAIKKLPRMSACSSYDGRSRRLVQYHGAGPGRWAGRLWQPHNLPRGLTRLDAGAGHGDTRLLVPPSSELSVGVIGSRDAEYVKMLLGNPVEAVVSSLRSTIIAAPGKTLVVGDFAGVEMRVSLALFGAVERCAEIEAGKDVYLDMASLIYGRPITKADVEERQTGKNTVLGCGFGMGGRKFWERYCRKQLLSFARKVIKVYRTEWAPEMPKGWAGLERAALRAVQTGEPQTAYGITYALDKLPGGFPVLVATLPSGRPIFYPDPRLNCRRTTYMRTIVAEGEEPEAWEVVGRKAMPFNEDGFKNNWEKDGQEFYQITRIAWDYADKQGNGILRVDAYGGLLTENVAQAMAADLLRHAMKLCPWPIVLTVHDEIMCETKDRPGLAEELRAIMCERPQWAIDMGIPIDATCWQDGRYRK